MNAIRRVVYDPDDWMTAAACRGLSHVFFPPDYLESKIERRRREAQAKSICAGCDVREECLAEAMAERERFGIWGGLNERERRAIFSRQRAARNGSKPAGERPSRPQTTESPQDIAGPGRPARLPAVVVRDPAMSTARTEDDEGGR